MKLLFVGYLTKIHSCEVFQRWLDFFHEAIEGILSIIERKQEIDFSSTTKLSFGDLQRFDLIGHQHERRSKDDNIIIPLRVDFVKLIEVHFSDRDVAVVLEKLLASRNVVLINVNSQHLSLPERIYDAVKRVSCGGANVQH